MRFRHGRRFRHGLGAELGAEALGKGRILAQRAGAIAALVAHRDDSAHDVFAPGVDRENLTRCLDRERIVCIAARLGDLLAQAAEIDVAQPFANDVEPFVVNLQQQIAPVDLDGLGETGAVGGGLGECLYVDPET